jgi:hypothetical protein
MKKWIFSVALTFSVFVSVPSEQNMIFEGAKSSPDKFRPHESQYSNPITFSDTALTVQPMQITGFQGDSLKKMNDALKLLEVVVNSDEFRDRVINFKNSIGVRAFASNKGMTNEEIFDSFMEGRETLQPNTPGEMNFFLNLYHKRWSKVIGYTSPETNIININWKFFRNFALSDVAGNLAHEWAHKIGFDHRSASERDSVPYAIGYIVEDLGSKMIRRTKLH